MIALNDQMDSGLEQSYFDIDPELYYGIHNNSCGFFPGVPPIMSEVDQESINELMLSELYASDISNTPQSWSVPM